jgi:carbamate kinase
VIALGGNALIDPRLPPTVDNQFAVTARAMEPVAELIESGVRVVLTHGNGPQIGFMQLRSELARAFVHEVPLDSLVADTQGALGYMIERDLREALARRGRADEIVTVITEVEVDPLDPSLDHPTKPVGRFFTAAEAARLAAERGWIVHEDSHRGWRRVVASPAPRAIVQMPTIRRLVRDGVVVIACGGGGIPVTREKSGRSRGVEGVVDKDLTSALLATGLGAGRLVLTTAVDAIYRDFGTDRAAPLVSTTPAELRALAAAGQFPAGSMGPKVQAAIEFLAGGGGEAIVCHPDQLVAALEGRAGTRVHPE